MLTKMKNMGTPLTRNEMKTVTGGKRAVVATCGSNSYVFTCGGSQADCSNVAHNLFGSGCSVWVSANDFY